MCSLGNEFDPDVVELVFIKRKSLGQTVATEADRGTPKSGETEYWIVRYYAEPEFDVQVPMDPFHPLGNQRVHITSWRLDVHQIESDL